MDLQNIESIKKLIGVQPAKLVITPQGIARQIQLMTEMQEQIASMEQQIKGMQRKLAKQGQTIARHGADLAAVSRERDKYRAALEAWQEKTEWVQQTAIGSELGKHRADVLRERIEALQRSRDELSARLADEQRLHIKVGGLQGAGAETLQRCLNAFRANRGTHVRMAGDDAIRVFQLAIQALDQPGEIGEAVGQLRRHAAQVQSTAERLTQLTTKK